MSEDCANCRESLMQISHVILPLGCGVQWMRNIFTNNNVGFTPPSRQQEMYVQVLRFVITKSLLVFIRSPTTPTNYSNP